MADLDDIRYREYRPVFEEIARAQAGRELQRIHRRDVEAGRVTIATESEGGVSLTPESGALSTTDTAPAPVAPAIPGWRRIGHLLAWIGRSLGLCP